MNNDKRFTSRRLTSRLASSSIIAIIICALASVSAYGQRASRAKAKQSKPAAISMMTIEAEQLLSDLGYWTGPVDGKMDTASRHALIAFQKVEGRDANGKLTSAELEALRNASRPAPMEGGAAHIEVDLTRQVLFVVDNGGVVTRVLSISSGNGEEFTSEGWTRRAITPTGRFKVHRKIDGKRRSPLGDLFYPNYFLSGIAIHGAPSVPAYPASHGCVRVPMFAAKPLHDMTPVGMTVIVHGDGLARAKKKTGSASYAGNNAMRNR